MDEVVEAVLAFYDKSSMEIIQTLFCCERSNHPEINPKLLHRVVGVCNIESVGNGLGGKEPETIAHTHKHRHSHRHTHTE